MVAPSRLTLSLGSVIRGRRRERGLSQEALAEATALHLNTIGLIERGRVRVTIEVLARIGEALGHKPSELLSQAEIAVNESGQ